MTPPLRWRLGVAGGVALVVLLVDQLTKLAVRAVGDALHVTVIPGVIDFLFVRNIGAAFSMGEGHGIAFAVLALAVIVAIAVYLVRAPQLAHLEVVGMAMVAGGAIGNAIDRLAFGFVTDFIATAFIDFPVFNVADIGITVGVVLALIGYMFLSPAAREVDATAELNARDEARAKRKAKQRGERARKIRERNEREWPTSIFSLPTIPLVSVLTPIWVPTMAVPRALPVRI